MQGLEYYIRSNTKLELVIHEMIDLVSRIENIHDRYEEYVAHYDDIERDTLESFARGVIDDGALSVKGMLPRIQSLVGGPTGNEFRVLGNRGLLELIANDMKASLKWFLCYNLEIAQINLNFTSKFQLLRRDERDCDGD